jgi:hypothetical protein
MFGPRVPASGPGIGGRMVRGSLRRGPETAPARRRAPDAHPLSPLGDLSPLEDLTPRRKDRGVDIVEQQTMKPQVVRDIFCSRTTVSNSFTAHDSSIFFTQIDKT